MEKNVRLALHELQRAIHDRYGKDAPAILLYGSHARGDATPESDMDVLLLYPHEVRPGVEIEHLQGILADLNLRYAVLVSVLPASEAQYRQSQQAFWQNVRREGVRLDSI